MTISFSRVESSGHLHAVPDPRPRDASDPGGKIPSFAAEMASAAGAVASPPPEVSAEVRAAARAAARLHELGRELRFDHGADGRLKVELRDTVSGKALRSVPTAEVFDFAEGKVTS
ncbi:MAG TPA: hypothetical protein VHA76_14395 [Solirubrobacterales bacterium]|nr:hypothetical protein [Solirubrobacterales bacterium]